MIADLCRGGYIKIKLDRFVRVLASNIRKHQMILGLGGILYIGKSQKNLTIFYMVQWIKLKSLILAQIERWLHA